MTDKEMLKIVNMLEINALEKAHQHNQVEHLLLKICYVLFAVCIIVDLFYIKFNAIEEPIGQIIGLSILTIIIILNSFLVYRNNTKGNRILDRIHELEQHVIDK